MKKTVKTILVAAGCLVAVLILAIAALPLWIGPVAVPVANSVVPGKTKTAFELGGFSFNQYNGKISVEDLFLANPDGYDEKTALRIKNVFVDVDMSTVLSKTVVIDELSVKDLFVSYVFNEGKDNFTVIGENCSSGEPADAASDIAGPDEIGVEDAGTEDSVADEDGADETRVIIRKMTLDGLRVKIGKVTIPLPEITLEGIGEKTEGATLSEVLDVIVNAIMKSLNSLGEGATALMGIFGDDALKIGGETGKVLEKTGDGLKKVTEALSVDGELDKSLKKLNKETGKAFDAIKDFLK